MVWARILGGLVGLGLAAVLAEACSASTKSGLREGAGSAGEGAAGSGGAGGILPAGSGGASGCATPCNAAKGEVCAGGKCIPGCDAAAEAPSNLGCEFWAVDLPNERGLNDAAAAQWGVVLSNASDAPASVTIEQNGA